MKEIISLEKFIKRKTDEFKLDMAPYKKRLKSLRMKEAIKNREPNQHLIDKRYSLGQEILKLHKKGLSMRKIAKTLGVSTTPVFHALRYFK